MKSFKECALFLCSLNQCLGLILFLLDTLQVTCAVRIRASVGSLPSPLYESQVFKAGLYVSVNSDYNMTIT